MPAGQNLNPDQFGPWYHASPKRFEEGDVLTPQPKGQRNFSASRSVVSMTNMHDTALHWGRKVIDKTGDDHFHVYEVEPEGPVTPWRADVNSHSYQEAHAPQARVKRMVFGHGVDELPEPTKTLGGGDKPWSTPAVQFKRDPRHGGWVPDN